MKLTKLAVGTILLSSSIFVSATPAFASEQNSTGVIKFNPDPNPLSIKSITKIEFGEQIISGDDQYYSAQYKQEVDDEGKALPDSLTVIDNRGTHQGWELQVKNDGFHSADKSETLANAELVIATKSAQALSDKNPLPSQLKTVTLANAGLLHTVVSASENEGVGTTTHFFGTAKADVAGKAANTDVRLNIPGCSKKVHDRHYETTLTWVLLDAPSANTPSIKTPKPTPKPKENKSRATPKANENEIN